MSDPYWYEKEIEELRTEIERLRALREEEWKNVRRETIEECARVAEKCYDNPNNDMGFTVPTAIRALKG